MYLSMIWCVFPRNTWKNDDTGYHYCYLCWWCRLVMWNNAQRGGVVKVLNLRLVRILNKHQEMHLHDDASVVVGNYSEEIVAAVVVDSCNVVVETVAAEGESVLKGVYYHCFYCCWYWNVVLAIHDGNCGYDGCGNALESLRPIEIRMRIHQHQGEGTHSWEKSIDDGCLLPRVKISSNV